MVWTHIAAFVGGVVFWHLFENPILNGLSRFFRKVADFLTLTK